MDDDLARIEGWLRALMGTWLVAFTVVELTTGSARVLLLAATMTQTAVLGGLMIVLATRRSRRAAVVWRIAFAIDAVVLSALSIAAADLGKDAVAMALLLPLPVLGAIRHRTVGGVIGAAVATLAMVVQLRLGHHPDDALLDLALGALSTLGLGLLLGMVIDLARDREHHLQVALADEREVAAGHERLDRLRRDVLAITGHELRSPLTSIKGTVLLLQRRREQLTHQQVDDFLRAVARQTDRVLGLVEDLDAMTRGDATKAHVEVGAVALTDVVEHVREVLPDLDFQVLGRTDTVVLADAARLEQVLINLLRNAGEHGGGTITLSWSAEQDRRRSRIHVSDEGPGVPTELRGAIFDRYVSGRHPSSEGKGSGLGLAISRELTEAMGGTLDLLQTQVGTVFGVTLRLAPTSPTTSRRRRAHDAAAADH